MPKNKRLPDSATLRLRVRVSIDGMIALGPGRIDLLETIAETGSIVEAAHRLEMSYMRAWTLIRDTNARFRAPLVSTERGGRRGGGAVLTPTGKRVLELYRSLEDDARAAANRSWRPLRLLLRRS